mgnify:CR=1 FL=1
MFRCAIESRDELPTTEVLRIKFIEESDTRINNRRGNNCRLNSSDAMLAKNQWRQNENKHGGSTEGTKRRDRCEIRCFKFKKKGHKAAECRTHRAKIANVSLSASKSKLNLPRWCLDSGAASHMSNDLRDFKKLEEVAELELSLTNNESAKISSTGVASLTAEFSGQIVDISLNQALHVPSKLLSVSKMTDKGCKVVFKRNCAFVYGADGKVKLNRLSCRVKRTIRNSNCGIADSDI